jgi:hypothetical protein
MVYQVFWVGEVRSARVGGREGKVVKKVSIGRPYMARLILHGPNTCIFRTRNGTFAKKAI